MLMYTCTNSRDISVTVQVLIVRGVLV
uniref:Uncharacterized protein n=1 Tax=Arundo donax TaxID=35708 RepID=A0A0A9HKS4_ARUDO